jgi:glutamate/tyrosine decarboxylase-like PLP-dependent enzyme
MSHDDLLKRTTDLALEFLDGLPERRVGQAASAGELRAALGGPLPEEGTDAREVIEHLARAADPGLIGTAGPRYFGFVIGGHVPAALAADWLTSTWDQNAGLYVTSPANSVVEEAAAGWLLELLGLPSTASLGFTTGCSMANFTALAAARHAVLARLGWDVERDGLFGAPPIEVVIGNEAHATILTALQMLGLGRERVKRVAVDGQGRMVPAALREMLAGGDGPLIVCAQAGNVDTGAFDPLEEIVPIVRESREGGGWLHVDGAFGLWAATVPELAHLVRGAAEADSWATDAHKWLNVPYDSGIVAVAHPGPHRAAMTISAAYLVQTEGHERDPFDWVPEFSRRARGFTVWAALKSLGRTGVAGMVERGCAMARRFADRLREEPGVEILNEVVLNQVLVRFHRPGGPAEAADPGSLDALTRDVIARVQADGTCWLSGTTWQGKAAMRISVSSWATAEADVDASAAAILRSFRAAC